MLVVKVPATSANMGPGFDSLGVALNLYLTVEVIEPSDTWYIEHEYEHMPHDHRNFLVHMIKKVSEKIPPHHLRMTSDIPLTRGLGSSSSAIVAAIEIADQLGNLQLSRDTKIQLATKFEGHPDNVVPAILGNMVASTVINRRVYWSKIYLKQMAFVALIPNKPLSTRKSRNVLPHEIPLSKAAEVSATSNVLVAHLSRGYYKRIKKLIENDQFHEPYRAELVPELLRVRELLKHEKTYGTYLSGAGPTVMTITHKHDANAIYHLIKDAFCDYRVCILDVDTQGVVVEKTSVN
ncbi:homoserine kinase [Carnobacteriaceae bacterium zg-ZUI252]|nr:homoserine kinase [Carnobacteriaceae bacterium zg-ZUI252]